MDTAAEVKRAGTGAEHWGAISYAELHALAERYGTPYFLYDAEAIAERIRGVRSSLDNRVRVFYAVKANPNLELLRAIRDSADGLDISSGGELLQARLAGFDASRISFAGPAKTSGELEAAIQTGVGCISVESLRELAACADIARRLRAKAHITLRVNPRLLNRAFGLKMGGRAVQFGIDEEALDEALDAVAAHADHLDFKGIHVYIGSQCFEPAAIAEGVADTLRIVHEIESGRQLVCSTVNLGGGFGVSHGAEERELDLDALRTALIPVLRAFDDRAGASREIVFELGRYLAANAGVYVARVISSKESRGKTFYMVDGGLHHHLAAAGTFGAALRVNFPLVNLSRPNAQPIRCNVAGPSCNPNDLLGIDVDLPRPEHGDLIAVLKAGSYGLTASPLLFLGRQTPAELVRCRGEVILGRRPRTIADFN